MQPSRDYVYFLHIPKTAGSSTHRFLVEHAGEGRATERLLWDNIARGTSPVGASTEIITGHFAGLLPLWYGRWPRIITMIREPISRSLSHINHVRRDSAHPLHERARGLDVVDYCADPVLRTTIADFQSRYLASLNFSRTLLRPRDTEPAPGGMSVAFELALCGLDKELGLEAAALEALGDIDVVGVADQFEHSRQLFAAFLGWTTTGEAPRMNSAGVDQQALDDLRPEELAALNELTTVDRVVYRHASARVANEYARLSDAGHTTSPDAEQEAPPALHGSTLVPS